MSVKIPSRRTFAAVGIINTLRDWKKQCQPAPLQLADIDIDALEGWADELTRAHDETSEALVEFGIIESPPSMTKR